MLNGLPEFLKTLDELASTRPIARALSRAQPILDADASARYQELTQDPRGQRQRDRKYGYESGALYESWVNSFAIEVQDRTVEAVRWSDRDYAQQVNDRFAQGTIYPDEGLLGISETTLETVDDMIMDEYEKIWHG
jgi:hypothetical protein